MNNKTKTGIFIVAVFAISAMVLIGQNAVPNGLVVGATKANTCTDTDGGNNINVKGTVYGIYSGKAYNYTDSCRDAIRLTEYFCNGKVRTSQAVNCPGNNTCSNGACIQAATTTTIATTTTAATTTTIPNSCTDTDGGNVPEVQGTVYGIAVGRGYNYTDYCMNDSLREYVCYSAKYSSMVVNCSQNLSCVNGACV